MLILHNVSDSEIDTIGKSKLGSLWLGVYPIDKIPFLTEGCFVVNTQTSTLPGEHWLAVNITKTCVKVFDPFGFYYPNLLVKKLTTLRRPIWFNRIQFQNILSKTCGQHCLVWLISINECNVNKN